MGLPLLIRHPRGVELTDAGKVLLEEARAVLGGSERLEATVQELRRAYGEPANRTAARLAYGAAPYAAGAAAGARAGGANRGS